MNNKLKIMLSAMSPDAQERLLAAMSDAMDTAHPGALDTFLDNYESSTRYRDYLSEDEARFIVDSFVNFDGSTGPKWSDSETLFRHIQEVGGKLDSDGEYNRWAAYAVVNMIYSDYGGVLRGLTDGERLFRTCWQMALALFRDKDRDEERNIRWYLGLEDVDK